MFDSLVLHDTTKATLKTLTAEPPQGLLFVGPRGIGKTTIANAFAAQIANDAAAIRVLTPDDKGTITIEVIRELYKAARGRQQGRQVIIIDDADGMSVEAENAFLKLLEEPRPGLTFILTARSTESMLPTILSRVQLVPLQPLTDDVIRRLAVSKKPGIAQADLAQLVFIANGRPATALQLLDETVLGTHRESAQRAKGLITAKPYERYLHIAKLAADRQGCLDGLAAMQRIIEVQLRAAQSAGQAAHWAGLANKIDATMTAIQNNGNIRAQLLYLFSSY